ncbi:unnamed protein product [Diabrotica balteata]|uniref:C-type lectin domain-containing protein n=1 Tax=Diabrotica balteata TaxID=107213 RepID=A0A9N9SRC6_DIABA|nr:unnamed protein product [Diabrotica balteata]
MLSLITYLFFFSSFVFSGSQAETCSATNPKNNYYLGDTQVTWANAIVSCQAVGMSLVSIQNQPKQDEVTKFLQSTRINYTGIENAIWTAGNRLQDEVHWRWLRQEPVVYTNWLNGEPNNATGDEKCLSVVFYGNTGWNDIACNRTYHPLCEKQICCSSCKSCS